jgi:hypothetical protein
MLAPDIYLAALPLRDDVVFTQKLFGCFTKSFFCFDFAAAKFSMELQKPVLCNTFCLRETLFFCTGAAIFAGEISGALPERAMRTLVDVNFSAEDGVLFGRNGRPPPTPSKSGNVKELCNTIEVRVLCQ